MIERGPTKIIASQNKLTWLCVCDCGVKKHIPGTDLRTGNTSSCGCLRKDLGPGNKKHGRSRTKGSYSVWCNMRARCNNESDDSYHRYGGRGIYICERWREFENFLADMGERPKGMQLERVDNDGPYAPENCVWATAAQQSRNRRSNINVTIEGETLCLLDWCGRLGMDYFAVRKRIKDLGWTPEKALSVPVRVHRNR